MQTPHRTARGRVPPRHLWGLLDLDIADHRDPARGLLEIRKGLHASGAIRTPVFDLAIATYWSSAYATEDIDRALKDVLRDNRDLISAVADAAPGWAALAVQDAGVPGLGLLVRGVAHARRLLKERGAKRACEALVDLENQSAAQILDRLPWFLGQDLIAHRADPGAPTPICFIDTYEALWSEHPDKAGPAALETDAWVRELVAAAPGTLFVILGRERLSWDRRFPDDWGDLLGDQHLLGGLADADADRFLAAIPIPDGAVRRALIAGAKADPGLCVAGSDQAPDPGPSRGPGRGPDPGAAVPQTPGPGDCGAHPFYLDLSVDTYLDQIDAGHTPVPDDFGRTHPEILARFMRHRTPTERETLKILAGPRAFDRTLFAALMERFRTRYSEGRFNDLVGYSFCEPGPDGRYRLHALMREHLLEELDPETRAAIDAFLFDWFDARCRPARPREVTAEHEAALREAVHHRGTGDAEAALDWFWGRAGVFHDAARHALLEPLYRWALGLAEDRLGPGHPETAFTLSYLAQLLQDTNHLAEAEPLMRRALGIDESSYGPEHPRVAIQLNNLAALLQAANRLAEAEPLMQRALAIDESSYGPEHPDVARDLNNLATLLQATNRLAEAELLMRRALAIDESIYGPEHPAVARDLNNLATLLQATNRQAEAEPLMRRALGIDASSYGPEHPRVAVQLNNLAQLLQATNRLAEAEPLMRRALGMDESSYGPEHPQVAIQLNNLAQLLQATNRLAEAEPLMQRALGIDESSYGPEHPRVAIDLNNLAQLLQATDRLAEAEPLMRRALAIDESSYGPEHPRVAIDLNNLAALLKATDRQAEAEPLMRRALAIGESSYGPDHPRVAVQLNNLALLLQATNRLAEAEPLMQRALAIDESSYGPEHPDVAIDLNNLAQLLKATDRLAEAEPLMRRALAIDESSYGPEHPDVAVQLNNLALLLQATNRLAEAEPLSRRMLGILLRFTRDTGYPHPHLRAAFGNYRALLEALSVPEDARARHIATLIAESGLDPADLARHLGG